MDEGEEEEGDLLVLYLREKVPRGVPSQREPLQRASGQRVGRV